MSIQQYVDMTMDASKILVLKVGNHAPTSGAYIPRADAQSAPSISLSTADPTKTYLAVCLDPDAPFQSFAFLGPILHWLQPGLKRGQNEDGALEATSPVITEYGAPGPPPGSSPHRYVFMLYEQPASFDVSKFLPKDGNTSRWSRVRFDWEAWAKKAGLSQPVAVNYFVSN